MNQPQITINIVDNHQIILLVSMGILTAVLSFSAAWKWRGSYIPVNSIFFIGMGILAILVAHYYYNLGFSPDDEGHRFFIGLRASRLLFFEIELFAIALSAAALVYRPRYYKRLKQILDDPRYKEELEEAIARIMEEKVTKGHEG